VHRWVSLLVAYNSTIGLLHLTEHGHNRTREPLITKRTGHMNPIRICLQEINQTYHYERTPQMSWTGDFWLGNSSTPHSISPPTTNHFSKPPCLVPLRPRHPASPSRPQSYSSCRIGEPVSWTESNKPAGPPATAAKNPRYVVPHSNTNYRSRWEHKWHCRLGEDSFPKTGTAHSGTDFLRIALNLPTSIAC